MTVVVAVAVICLGAACSAATTTQTGSGGGTTAAGPVTSLTTVEPATTGSTPAGTVAPTAVAPPSTVAAPAPATTVPQGALAGAPLGPVAPVTLTANWTPIGVEPGGVPALFGRQLPGGASAVWMDPRRLRFALHPGLAEPAGQWPGAGIIARDELPDLVAAFNGGFKMADSHGGFFADGVGEASLVAGAATFAVLPDGTATVGAWGRDVGPADNVVAARQNLTLIVDGGRPAPTVSDSGRDAWGATLGARPFVWRSAIGVSAQGALVYVGGPGLSSRGLAAALVTAGAVRAMELDINATWVTFNLYGGAPGSPTGTKLRADMTQPGDRYLTSDHRDFVTVLARPDPGPPQSPPT